MIRKWSALKNYCKIKPCIKPFKSGKMKNKKRKKRTKKVLWSNQSYFYGCHWFKWSTDTDREQTFIIWQRQPCAHLWRCSSLIVTPNCNFYCMFKNYKYDHQVWQLLNHRVFTVKHFLMLKEFLMYYCYTLNPSGCN